MNTWLIIKSYAVPVESLNKGNIVDGELTTVVITQIRQFKYGTEVPVVKTMQIEAETIEDAMQHMDEAASVKIVVGELTPFLK